MLNYNPTVPMDMDAPMAAPSVALPAKIQEVNAREPDFVMNEARAEARRRQPPAKAVEQQQNWMPPHIVTEDVEFRKYEDQKKLDEGRKSRIDDITREILALHVPAMKKYRRAQKRLTELTKDEQEHPTEQTLRDRRIVRKGPPITKEEARTQAYEQLVKFGW
jgi:hypothetical protein